MKQEQHYQLDDGQQHALTNSSGYSERYENPQRVEEMFPGVPIVRGNTPRPLSFNSMISASNQLMGIQQVNSGAIPTFPTQAPSAPPLPEEVSDEGDESFLALPDTLSMSKPVPANPIVISNSSAAMGQHDLIWLFEYGLEMDIALLNSPERLHGHALPAGPAVLRGYKVAFGAQYICGNTGPTIMAIEPSSEPDAEVWGVLYQVPYRFYQPGESGSSLLDTIHAAITPQNFFKGVQVVVYDIERDRDVTSIVYVATSAAREQLNLVSADQWEGDSSFSQRLAAIARRHRLPEHYVRQYDAFAFQNSLPNLPSPPDLAGGPAADDANEPALAPANTPALDKRDRASVPPSHGRTFLTANNSQHSFVAQASQTSSQTSAHANRWLTIFSLYLVGLLLFALVFAGLQSLGLGHRLVANQFNPLGVPWLVLMYGLLGGCVSCIVTLGRFRTTDPPLFIIISWFTRPFIGAILAILAFLLLTSGIFAFDGSPGSITHHMTLFWLVGALAGFAESWIFFRRV
ncbi:MAG: hypothetical protein NVS2B12_07470 [Ktedonobacteraceae bacterium]